MTICHSWHLSIVLASRGGYEGARGIPPRRSSKKEKPISRKVFVGNLNFDTTQEGLSQAFAGAGQIVSVHIGRDRETGRSRGFAFVEFTSDEEAQRAITSFNETELDGRRLRVSTAEDRPPRRPFSPSGPGGGPPGRSFAPAPSFGEPEADRFSGGGFGRPFNKPKGSRRGLRARKRSLS